MKPPSLCQCLPSHLMLILIARNQLRQGHEEQVVDVWIFLRFAQGQLYSLQVAKCDCLPKSLHIRFPVGKTRNVFPEFLLETLPSHVNSLSCRSLLALLSTRTALPWSETAKRYMFLLPKQQRDLSCTQVYQLCSKIRPNLQRSPVQFYNQISSNGSVFFLCP